MDHLNTGLIHYLDGYYTNETCFKSVPHSHSLVDFSKFLSKFNLEKEQLIVPLNLGVLAQPRCYNNKTVILQNKILNALRI